jgi:hypothetical protein
LENFVRAAHPEHVEGSGEEIIMSFWVYILECADGSYYTDIQIISKNVWLSIIKKHINVIHHQGYLQNWYCAASFLHEMRHSPVNGRLKWGLATRNRF